MLCRHPHLLPLLGYCLDERALSLVYPLMVAGNLEELLELRGDADATDEIALMDLQRSDSAVRRKLLLHRLRTERPNSPIGRLASHGRGSSAPGGQQWDAEAPSLGCWDRVRIVTEATRALVYLHTAIGEKGVILHRDVKVCCQELHWANYWALISYILPLLPATPPFIPLRSHACSLLPSHCSQATSYSTST